MKRLEVGDVAVEFLRKAYHSVRPYFPKWLRERLDAKPTLMRLSRTMTALLGRKNTINQRLLEIDITFDCNLKCFHCNRSCTQAPSRDRMSLRQIGAFARECIENERSWDCISVMGGEPTVHPDLSEILDTLLTLKAEHGLVSKIQLVTNGYGQDVTGVLATLPAEIEVVNSHKTNRKQEFHYFNFAPIDTELGANLDYANGCRIVSVCGMGLNRYGYYPCSVAAGIDRVFGFDIGRKQIPALDCSFTEELRCLCKFCGQFVPFLVFLREEQHESFVSSSWKGAYRAYRERRPVLTLYGGHG